MSGDRMAAGSNPLEGVIYHGPAGRSVWEELEPPVAGPGLEAPAPDNPNPNNNGIVIGGGARPGGREGRS